MLWLNRISTNHDINWLRGLLFTILTSIVFYTLYLFSLPTRPFHFGWVSWHSFLKASDSVIEYFLRFFILTHDLDFMQAYSPTSLNYLIDILGKFFIAYGIYQTIQAFRKYGKQS